MLLMAGYGFKRTLGKGLRGVGGVGEGLREGVIQAIGEEWPGDLNLTKGEGGYPDLF